jgi:acetylglutamate kinase
VRGTVVLKIGGSVMEQTANVAAAVAVYELGLALVVVHGGGPLIGQWSERAGLETRFVRGLRVTDDATRDIALAVLAGLVNKQLVASLLARGVPAVGISGVDGYTLRAELEGPDLGLVGRVTMVDSALIEDLLATARVPVVAPAAIVGAGQIVNVNADAVAGALAASIDARLLAIVTDVPGVRAKDGHTIHQLDRAHALELIADGTIEGGMLPKVEACLTASAAGCQAAIVGPQDTDAIERILAGERAGTVFTAEAAIA